MTLLQFKNISLLKLDSGDILGFHNENLEVARLDAGVWEAAQQGRSGEELEELQSWSRSVNRQVKRAVLEQKVKTLTVNTTQLCNLRCTYCAAGGDGTYGSPSVKIDLKKGLPQLEWLMSRCLPGERFQINYLGGEPLLYPDVMREISKKAAELAEIHQVALRFSVVTNGTQLHHPAVLDLLKDFRMAVTVSVDGPPEVQDRFRPNKKNTGEGSSVDLEKGLIKLQEIKNRLPSIGLAAVFHKEYTNVLEAYQYFLKWDFDFYEFNYSHTDFDPQGSREYTQGLQKVAQLADSLGGEDEFRKIRSFDSILNRLDEQVKLENFCGSGKSLLSMDAKGDLYACPWDINDKSLKMNDSSSMAGLGVDPGHWSSYAAPQVEKPVCHQCWAKFVCGGGCNYVHRGGTSIEGTKIDPIFCERTQSLIITMISYYEKYRRVSNETH